MVFENIAFALGCDRLVLQTRDIYSLCNFFRGFVAWVQVSWPKAAPGMMIAPDHSVLFISNHPDPKIIFDAFSRQLAAPDNAMETPHLSAQNNTVDVVRLAAASPQIEPPDCVSDQTAHSKGSEGEQDVRIQLVAAERCQLALAKIGPSKVERHTPDSAAPPEQFVMKVKNPRKARTNLGQQHIQGLLRAVSAAHARRPWVEVAVTAPGRRGGRIIRMDLKGKHAQETAESMLKSAAVKIQVDEYGDGKTKPRYIVDARKFMEALENQK